MDKPNEPLVPDYVEEQLKALGLPPDVELQVKGIIAGYEEKALQAGIAIACAQMANDAGTYAGLGPEHPELRRVYGCMIADCGNDPIAAMHCAVLAAYATTLDVVNKLMADVPTINNGKLPVFTRKQHMRRRRNELMLRARKGDPSTPPTSIDELLDEPPVGGPNDGA